jgi:hypothetical protein
MLSIIIGGLFLLWPFVEFFWSVLLLYSSAGQSADAAAEPSRLKVFISLSGIRGSRDDDYSNDNHNNSNVCNARQFQCSLKCGA